MTGDFTPDGETLYAIEAESAQFGTLGTVNATFTSTKHATAPRSALTDGPTSGGVGERSQARECTERVDEGRGLDDGHAYCAWLGLLAQARR